jgi:hypothetical protein
VSIKGKETGQNSPSKKEKVSEKLKADKISSKKMVRKSISRLNSGLREENLTKASNQNNVMNFDRISMRNGARLSCMSHRSGSGSRKSYTSTRGKDYLFENPGEFKELLDEFLLKSHNMKLEKKQKNDTELSPVKDLRRSPEPDLDLLAFQKLRGDLPDEKKDEVEEREEPDWNAVINPKFLVDKY